MAWWVGSILYVALHSTWRFGGSFPRRYVYSQMAKNLIPLFTYIKRSRRYNSS